MIYFVLEYYVVALKAKLPQNGSGYVFPKGYHPFPFDYSPSPVPNPSPTFLILSLHNTVVGVTDETRRTLPIAFGLWFLATIGTSLVSQPTHKLLK